MIIGTLKKKFIPFVLIAAIAIGTIAAVNHIFFKDSDGKVNFISDAVGIVISPVQGAFSWVFDNITHIGVYFSNLDRLEKENVQLKKDVLQLQADLSEKEKYEQENERLRGLLDLKTANKNFDTVGASVIGREANFSTGIIRIDKGTIDGISKNDVVTDSGGLVGYISEIGTTWADVTTILAPETSVSCILPRTGEIIMLGADISGSRKKLCKLSYISPNSTISVGEAVETSGEGGIYPEGLFVGRIEDISDEKNGIAKEAVLKPMADFSSLREVLVIKLGTDGQN